MAYKKGLHKSLICDLPKQGAPYIKMFGNQVTKPKTVAYWIQAMSDWKCHCRRKLRRTKHENPPIAGYETEATTVDCLSSDISGKRNQTQGDPDTHRRTHEPFVFANKNK